MITRLLPFAALALALGLVLGYIMPTYKGPITESTTQLKSFEAAISAAKTFQKKKEELKQRRDAISQSDIDRLQAYLPDSVNNVQLILDIDALAARSGMVLSAFDVKTDGSATTQNSGALQSTNPVDSLELTLSASGTYTEFRNFLAGIEQSLRPMDIESIQITSDSSSQTSGGGAAHKFNITLRIYWLH